jgi:hypothetical protein
MTIKLVKRAGFRMRADGAKDEEIMHLQDCLPRHTQRETGHTVWGVHAERRKGEGYKGKPKRKPRSEWTIQRDTHPAIITDAEAEAILKRLTESKCARGSRKPSTYALSGLLKTPAGRTWQGNGRGGYYVRGQSVPTQAVEQAVIERIVEDVSKPALLK